MSIKSRVLAFLTCLVLGISLISPAFVRADEPSPTPTSTPTPLIIDGVDCSGLDAWDILKLTILYQLVDAGADLFWNGAEEVTELMDGVYSRYIDPAEVGTHRFASLFDDDYDNAVINGLVSGQEFTVPYKPEYINSYINLYDPDAMALTGSSDNLSTVPERYRPYVERISNLTNRFYIQAYPVQNTSQYPAVPGQYDYYYYAFEPDAPISFGGSLLSYDFTTPGYTWDGQVPDLSADGNYMPHGGLDFISRADNGFFEYYKSGYRPGDPYPPYGNFDGTSTTTAYVNAYLTQRRLALLLPATRPGSIGSDGWYYFKPASGYGVTPYSNGYDRIRYADDIFNPINDLGSSVSDLPNGLVEYSGTMDRLYSDSHQLESHGSYYGYTSGFFVTDAPYSYFSTNDDISYISQSTLANGTRAYIGNDNAGTTYDDYLEAILRSLSLGFAANVDLYIGDSWAEAVPLTSPDAWYIASPEYDNLPGTSDPIYQVQLPDTDEAEFNPYRFYVWLINNTTNVTVNNPVTRDDLPTNLITVGGDPAPRVTTIPNNTPKATTSNKTAKDKDAKLDPSLGGNQVTFDVLNGGDIDGESGGFWSRRLSLFDPDPTPALTIKLSKAGGVAGDGPAITFDMSNVDEIAGYKNPFVDPQDGKAAAPHEVAYELMVMGSAFLNNISEYVWYIVGLLVITTLVIRLLHG